MKVAIIISSIIGVVTILIGIIALLKSTKHRENSYNKMLENEKNKENKI